MPDLSGFFSFFIIIVILFAAYVTTKWYATKSKGMTRGKYIEVVDRVVLGKDKGVVIVKIGQKIFLMSESSTGLSTVTELCEEDLSIVFPQSDQSSFKDIINTYLGIAQGKVTAIDSSNNLSELKLKVSDSLNRMINRHKLKEQTDDEEKKIV